VKRMFVFIAKLEPFMPDDDPSDEVTRYYRRQNTVSNLDRSVARQ
jgi:hypothetical protein